MQRPGWWLRLQNGRKWLPACWRMWPILPAPWSGAHAKVAFGCWAALPLLLERPWACSKAWAGPPASCSSRVISPCSMRRWRRMRPFPPFPQPTRRGSSVSRTEPEPCPQQVAMPWQRYGGWRRAYPNSWHSVGWSSLGPCPPRRGATGRAMPRGCWRHGCCSEPRVRLGLLRANSNCPCCWTCHGCHPPAAFLRHRQGQGQGQGRGQGQGQGWGQKGAAMPWFCRCPPQPRRGHGRLSRQPMAGSWPGLG